MLRRTNLIAQMVGVIFSSNQSYGYNAIKRQRRQDKNCQERYNIHWISVWFLTSVQMLNCIGNNIRLQATKKYIFYNSAGTKEELFP